MAKRPPGYSVYAKAKNPIKLLRKKLRLKQSEFAYILGLKPNTISVYELGTKNQRPPSIRTCRKIIMLAASKRIKVTMEALRPNDYI